MMTWLPVAVIAVLTAVAIWRIRRRPPEPGSAAAARRDRSRP